MFAASFLPPDMPLYWNVVTNFANQAISGAQQGVTTEEVKLVIENMKILYSDGFSFDADLTQQIIAMDYSLTNQPLGIPLVSSEIKCHECGGQLFLRRDRPSRLTLYTASLGTVPATHFHKLCRNSRKGCHVVQYYGYSKSGIGSMFYDTNWMTLPYFLSSQETGFEMKILNDFDVELLIGQISYKQKSDIYNISKGYDTTRKTCTTMEANQEAHKPPVHG